ncbi:SMI1/KNR4 family protein [Enterobacteriaceae bacterium BIT-l23]|jgi:hypothetical protein|uniref:SMI1/KNR4 family protein n=1 Tax=Jejubacter sp. L23 TaxID=3092086 RepID=UPI001584AEEB|nr:SMI1/KNR4 family protein [Enterobacteriaceae bacterium BIT-l23]
MEFLTVNTSKALTDKVYNEFERVVNVRFSNEIKMFYLSGNGGELSDERCIYISDDGMELDVKYFLPITYPRFDGDLTVEHAYFSFVERKKIIPEGYIPFAITNGGFPFCISKVNEQIYFANIESDELIFLDNTLNSFLSKIITEDEAWG